MKALLKEPIVGDNSTSHKRRTKSLVKPKYRALRRAEAANQT